MAFENKNFKVVKKTQLPSGEITLSCRLTADGEITKIFALSFNAYPGASEITEGAVSYNGKVDICMIYELSTGEIASTFSSCPFTSKFEGENISFGEKAIISLKEVDYSIESLNGSEANISVTLEQSGLLIQGVDVKSISSNDQNVCVKEEEFSVIRYIGSGSTSATESAQATSREKIKKVLGSQTSVVVKDSTAGVNFVSVSGDIVTNLLFIDENDRFSSVQVYDNFKEEIEIEGVSQDSAVEAISFVNSENVKISVEEDDKGAKIVATVPFEITAYAFEESKLNMIVDLYSTQNEMEISTESFSMSKTLAPEYVEGKVDGSLTIDSEQPRVDKILFNYASFAQVTNTYVANGELVVEGIAKTTVVYLNDEAGSLNSVEIEVPFQISEKTDATEQANLLASAILTDADVSVKKGRELFFDGKVRAFVLISEDEISAVITEAREGESYPERDYAMQVVFAKQGDSLWNLAKQNHVSENLIREQNPTALFPLEENKEIIIFYQNA